MFSPCGSYAPLVSGLRFAEMVRIGECPVARYVLPDELPMHPCPADITLFELRDALADATGVRVHHSSVANLLSRLGLPRFDRDMLHVLLAHMYPDCAPPEDADLPETLLCEERANARRAICGARWRSLNRRVFGREGPF